MRGASERAWFRQNPALPTVTWSIRNNVNYQQSALLFAFHDMAQNRARFLEQYWMKGQRAVAKAVNEGPAAWVFDAEQKRPENLSALLDLLHRQGIEVHVAGEAFSITTNWLSPEDDKVKVEAVKFAKGSFIGEERGTTTPDGRCRISTTSPRTAW